MAESPSNRVSKKAQTPAKARFFDGLPVFLMIFAKQILAKVEVTHRGVTIDSTSFAKQL